MRRKIEIGHIVFLILCIFSITAVSRAAFTTLNTTDTLSNFPTTYNANLNKTVEMGTTSVASITTLSSLSSIGTITTGTWATNLSGSFINQLGNSVIPFSTSGTLATSSAKIYFDSNLGTIALASSTLSATASTSGSFFAPNRVEASDIRATSTLTLRGIQYTPPSADGSSGQTLRTNGSGTLSWVTGNTMSFTAGQALALNDPVAIEATSNTASNTQMLTDNSTSAICDTNFTERAQIFQEPRSMLINAMDVRISKTGSPAGNILVRIVPMNGGVPSRTQEIASSTILAADITGSEATYRVNFYPAVYLGANTKAAIRFSYDTCTPNAGNYFLIGGTSSSLYGNGDRFNFDGATWTATQAADLYFNMYDVGTTEGRVYLASSISTSTASTTIGFSSGAVATSGAATILGTGNVISGLRTLITAGTPYLGIDPRTILGSGGVVSKALGIMISATSMLVHINPW